MKDNYNFSIPGSDTNAQLIKFINEIERELPVDTWRIFGIDMWPAIRVKIAPIIYNKILHSQNNVAVTRKQRFFSKVTTISQFIKSIYYFIMVFIQNCAQIGAENVEWLVGTGMDEMKIGRYWIDRFLLPSKQSKVTSMSWDMNNSGKQSHLTKKIIIKCLDNIVYIISRVLVKVVRFTSVVGFDLFLKKLSMANVDIKHLDIMHIHMYAIQIKALYYFFSVFSRFYDLKSIYIVAYYSHFGHALSLLARKKNIPFVDVQHGLFTNHPAYVKYTKVPVGGYNTIPSHFWVWDDESSRQFVADSSENFTKKHTIFKVGIPDIMPLFATFANKSDLQFLEHVAKQKKSILVTLQPEMYDPGGFDNLAAAILELGTDYYWLIRQHPAYSADKRGLHKILSLTNYDNVNYKEAVVFPIQVLLNVVNLHITYNSSSAIEARAYGIKTIFLSKDSKESFPWLLESGNAIYIAGKNSIISALRGIVGND